MEVPSQEGVIIAEPVFRDALQEVDVERIDHMTFTGGQPKVSAVLGWIMAHLKQDHRSHELTFELQYVDDDQDMIMEGTFDAVSTVAESVHGPFARLNWGAIGDPDRGGSAIFMYESGYEPCELQLITAAKQPIIEPSGVLDYVARQYASSK